MKKTYYFVFALLFMLSGSLFYAQDDSNSDINCEDYISNLRQEIFDLTDIFNAYLGYQTSDGVYDLSVALQVTIEDYQLWVDRRITWETLDPIPSCALFIHDNVISLYASIGDIYTYTLYSLNIPNDESITEQVELAYKRVEANILDISAEIETVIDGEPVDLNGSLAALDFLWNLYQFEVPLYATN